MQIYKSLGKRESLSHNMHLKVMGDIISIKKRGGAGGTCVMETLAYLELSLEEITERNGR